MSVARVLGSGPSDRRRGALGLGAAFIWLAFIVYPLVNAITHHGDALDRALTIAGAVAFIAAYVALLLNWRRGRRAAVLAPLFVVMVVIATALTVSQPASWAFLFTYCAACTVLIASAQVASAAVVIYSLLAAGTSLIAGASGAAAIGYAATAAGIGLLMLLLRDLRVRNEELTSARAELARLAVAAERERFARDLHDLLGHTLSVITLKAELAGRLLPDRPERAAAEVAELEEVARTALGEVREAVSGYRQPTLAQELAGARMALSAAGIDAQIEPPTVALAPPAEAVLAWAVREGATNVIRHSGALHCAMRVIASPTDATLEVTDDGHGRRGRGTEHEVGPLDGGDGRVRVIRGGEGHGLAGLAERAESLHGTVEAGFGPEGGFRLLVTVPVNVE